MFCVGLDAQLKMNELGKLELILVRPVQQQATNFYDEENIHL